MITEDIVISGILSTFVYQVSGLRRTSLSCLQFDPFQVALCYLFVEDLVPAARSLWQTWWLYAFCLPGSDIGGGFFFTARSGYL